SWGLGLAAVSKQKAYRGFDRETNLLPLVEFENQYVRVFGPGLRVKLPGLHISETQRLNFSLVGKYDFSGYEADDSPFLAGMRERKGGFWAGARAEWQTSVAKLSTEWTADTSGHSKGQMLSLGIEKTWRFGQHVMLTPRVVAVWQDRKYVDYYYGVRADEVRPGRAVYRGESAVNAEVGLRGVYTFDRNHSVFLDVGATRLASEIRNSPLASRSSENTLLLGYVYRFR
ncbi:MAG TPA: MipA/OmpV family protein, partial [Ramlibacter sp.]|nr:MipA/OmpV family protein [Ramlibacter sp.]